MRAKTIKKMMKKEKKIVILKLKETLNENKIRKMIIKIKEKMKEKIKMKDNKTKR